MSELTEIIGDCDKFLSEILGIIQKEGFDFGDFAQIDHICYRTVSQENYSQKKREISKIANLLGETMVNGRPISTFRLKKPIIHKNWRIDAIELPAPKEGAQHTEGLEHIEFVLFDDITTFLKKYPDKQFDLRAVDRGINPEIGLKLSKYSVKFHLMSLPTVVFLEQKLGIDSVKDN